jgi:hypothetical protein
MIRWMAKAAIRAMAMASLLGLSLGPTLVHANEILVIGDSWAEPIGWQLRNVLFENGYPDVLVHTTPFRRGREFDSPEGLAALSDWLGQWPDVTHLYMMMGQNEWLCCWDTNMIGSQEETELFTSIVSRTDSVLNHILSIRPDLRIVWTTGEYFRPHHLGTPAQVNANHDRLAELAADYASDRAELTFLNWIGLFQVTYGFDGVQHSPYDPPYAIQAGDPSLPDSTLPSPYVAYPEGDPEHPTAAGYKVMAQTLFDRYFAAELSANSFRINAGLNDAWYDPATAGQGFLITVFPDVHQMFVAWFTFDTERPLEDVGALLGDPGQRWLTAQGPYDGDTADLTVFVTGGGVFDSAMPAASTDPAGDGTLTLEFADCTEGVVTYAITSLGISGEIPIQRISLDNVPLCELLDQPEQQAR